MAWLQTTVELLYLAVYPVIYVVSCIASILHVLVTPFVNLGLAIVHITLLPLRILAKFEALFIFLCVALLIGAFMGLVLYFICTSVVDFLHFAVGSNGSTPRQADRKVRSKSQTQTTRAARDVKGKQPLLSEQGSFSDYFDGWDGAKDSRLLGEAGPVLSSTILEEDEYSQGSTPSG